MNNKIPDVNKCCGCVTDLRSAAAIIAVMGIVTSPAVAWAIVRHAYLIRISCIMSTSQQQPDVVDINFRNILSFGLGANAGLGASCLSGRSNHTENDKPELNVRSEDNTNNSNSIVQNVKHFGWFVLIADIITLGSSLYFLVKIFKGSDRKAAQIFIITTSVSIALSFVYGIFYVSVCISIGGGFPLYELFFTFFDLILWTYFLIMVKSYMNKSVTTR